MPGKPRPCASATCKTTLLALLLMPVCALAADEERPKAAPVPAVKPASQPVAPGEFTVGIITITFKDTAINGTLANQWSSLNTVVERHDESGTHSSTADEANKGDTQESTADEANNGDTQESATDEANKGVTQKEYFKIYSNDISWPKLEAMPDAATVYQDPYFYGYYCEYHYWDNPMGWKTSEEGNERVEKMNRAALRFAQKNYKGGKPRFLCYNYITTRIAEPGEELTKELRYRYEHRNDDKPRRKIRKTRRSRRGEDEAANEFKPWEAYRPVCRWGQPLWPNSKIQIHDSSGGTFAHELGHCLGAPDVYRIGRANDGIGGEPSPYAYGPTANAFSRFYHHAFIKAANHPTLTTSGSYTLHPRHIKPTGSEALGYLIPSNHPHYFYQLEYIHNENDIVGVGPGVEGMLISVVNLGRTNYLGSPDYFYVYRPNDPFFRGTGDVGNCLFGSRHKRTAFNMTTEPSSRLPNLLDGGVSLKNIQEHQDTLTFDLEIRRKSVSGSDYTQSMLPQIRLDPITDIQATSFTMDCTIKFRGEPLKTTYGFCWSKSSTPTIRDATYALCHREIYRGHAVNLEPDTTYHVRAFATNGLGYRYSDEELVVKTAPLATPPSQIGPLLTDRFSNNEYLYLNYSQEQLSSSQEFANYSPTCVLAKLIAYYRPKDFALTEPNADGDKNVNFNRMNWDPIDDDPSSRLEDVDGFFEAVMARSKEFGLRETEPEKDFVRNLAKFTGVRSKPVLTALQADNLDATQKLMRNDLTHSRPVIVIFCPKWKGAKDMIVWGIIDGINDKGDFHLDLPLYRKLMRDNEPTDFKTGHYSLKDLIIPDYSTRIVSSCFYER